MTGSNDAAALLRVEDVVKAFPNLVALDEVSLDVHPGEVVAVLGHNGSGKSTLVKVLAGVYSRDSGSVDLAPGTELHIIHQDLALVGELSTVENLTLMRGEGAAAAAPFDRTAERDRARELIGRFGESFDVDAPVRELSNAQRAVVAISRALDGWTHSANVIVLDESTESLHRGEVDVLFDAVRRLASEGAGVLFVSHRLDEVLALADRAVVLRDGRKVADEPIADLDHGRLVELITGARADEVAGAHESATRSDGDPVLEVRGLAGGTVAHLDLDVRPGEVVGIAGVLGSGREVVPSLLFGATNGSCAMMRVAGRAYERRSPAASLRRGIAFVPSDRARWGSIRDLTARENMTLPQMRTLTGPLGAISDRRERTEVQTHFEAFDVRPPLPEQRLASFSGGNQQKIVMARALRDAPAVLLLDEPTQGVDIGAKAAIYASIDAAAARGSAVVVASSDAKELLRLCDRVIVMRDGADAAQLSGADLTEHRLVAEGYGLA